ncbi:MAG TPA: precorrin-8X methylmutase [Fibrobacteraceae bacterium]|nr:precorrin-8X methylmutase [Fibrobacteraceae bacterium]
MTDPTRQARITQIPATALQGENIEATSLACIQKLLPQGKWTEGEWQVACRMVHACGDPAIGADLLFQHHAVEAGIIALQKGCFIYADSHMQRAGISLSRLRQIRPDWSAEQILCHVADPDVADQAREHHLARSLFALRKAAPHLQQAIVAIGNAPVALLELNRLILEEDLRPALVIGVPVGFVHVEESKDELVSLPVPAISLRGRRGGSSLAVAALHALMIQAISQRKPHE